MAALVGSRWMPFAADQVLRAGVGFVRKPIVGGHVVRFVGADILGPDGARKEFRLHGLIPVATAPLEVDRADLKQRASLHDPCHSSSYRSPTWSRESLRGQFGSPLTARST